MILYYYITIYYISNMLLFVIEDRLEFFLRYRNDVTMADVLEQVMKFK